MLPKFNIIYDVFYIFNKKIGKFDIVNPYADSENIKIMLMRG